MTIVKQTQEYAYAVGEEVLVRTANARVFDLERAAPVPQACLPDWMIGEVAGRRRAAGQEGYVVRVRRHGRRCVVLVEATQIEGTA